MKLGKAAMCTKITTAKPTPTSRNGGAYGDVLAAIETVEIVDIPPGKVLRIGPVEGKNRHSIASGGAGHMGIFPGTDETLAASNQGFSQNQQPQTEMVDYTELASDQLVIKVHASALNYPDLSMMTHVYQTRPDPPFCLGYEAAGEVIRVCGKDATYDGHRGILPPPKVGDRVFVNVQINSHSSRFATSASNCTPIPDPKMTYD